MKRHYSVSAPGNVIRPFGVSHFHESTTLTYRSKRPGHSKLAVAYSENGAHFTESDDAPVIMYPSGKSEEIDNCSNLKLTSIAHKDVATYIRHHEETDKSHLAIAVPDEHDWDIATWESLQLTRPIVATSAAMVPEHKSNGHYVLYFANQGIKLATARGLDNWHIRQQALLKPRKDYFDHGELEVIAAHYQEQGILLIYSSRYTKRFREHTDIGAAFIAHDNPAHVHWRSDEPLWSIAGRRNSVSVLGAEINSDKIMLYAYSKREKMFLVSIENPIKISSPSRGKATVLQRHRHNPVIAPADDQEWGAMGTFNPAVMVDDTGVVHMLYRALGHDGISRLGYARSKCGFDFSEALKYPVYAMRKGSYTPPEERRYDTELYPSGGSWSGAEDPRMVAIDGKVYVTFNAFDGWEFIRATAVSIDEKKFREGDFDWDEPVLLSPEGQINKNWVLFPERIDGKFAILHSINPEVQIDYVENLEDLGNGKRRIDSRFGGKTPRSGWDTWVRGAGPPPIRTDAGWLVLYHATDKKYPSQYRLGAMLLDHDNPTKIIARSHSPVLTPDMWYENEWKPGVVYACGAIQKGDHLFVYYGGGDRHVCVATANIDEFINELTQDKKPHLNPVVTS